jgi:hypothetical protein
MPLTLGAGMKRTILILAAILMISGWSLTEGLLVEGSHVGRISGLLVFVPGVLLGCVGIFYGYRYKNQLEFLVDVLRAWRVYVPMIAGQIVGGGIGYVFIESNASLEKFETGGMSLTVLGFIVGLCWYGKSSTGRRVKHAFPVIWFLGILSILALLTGLGRLRAILSAG